MTSRIAHVTLDCTDIEAVARFWAAALDRPIVAGQEGEYAYVGGEGEPFRLCVMRTPDGKVAKNRMHLDIEVGDRAVEVKRLLGLGAEIVADYDDWTTLRDVEGNEFCVF